MSASRRKKIRLKTDESDDEGKSKRKHKSRGSSKKKARSKSPDKKKEKEPKQRQKDPNAKKKLKPILWAMTYGQLWYKTIYLKIEKKKRTFLDGMSIKIQNNLQYVSKFMLE